MWRSFGGSSGMGFDGGGARGGGGMFRTVTRVSRAGLNKLKDKSSPASSSSSSFSARKSSKRGLSLSSKSADGCANSAVLSNSNLGFGLAWPPPSSDSCLSDDSDCEWVCVRDEFERNGVESDCVSVDDCVFGSAPSAIEAETALISLRKLLLVDTKVSYVTEPDHKPRNSKFLHRPNCQFPISMPKVSTYFRILPICTRNPLGLPLLTILQSKQFTSSPPSSPVPTHEHIAHLILDQKSPSQALQTFRWATKLPNFTHNQSTYRALINRLCAFRRFDDAHQLLDEMPSSIGSPPDEDIFVTIIRGLGRAHRIKEVIRVPDLVTKFNVNPSLKIYNSVLDVLVKEDIDIAREFYRKKIMDRGVKADDYTFGILMKGLCLTNRIGDGFKLLQAMKLRGVTPNAVVYNTLLQALCKNGKVGRARSLMNEMPETNDVTYNLMISAYCKEDNLVQSLVLLEKSLGLGFVPDAVTVTKIVELLCKVGHVDEAVEILERVEACCCRVDVVAYNTLIKGFCDLGKAKVAVRYLKKMEMKGLLPNVQTYNALISGFCEIGMLDMALDLFHDMKTDGITWNLDSYDILIKALCSKGRVEDGFKILELMELSRGGSGGRISPYNSVIYGLYLENRYKEALEFLRKMEILFPRAVDRSLKILGFCDERSVENAKEVYDQLVREGGVPCVLVYASLIRVLSQQNCVREAFELMNQMISCKYYPVLSTYNSLIHSFCSQGKVTNACKLMEDMIIRGCIPDAETYCPIIDALCRKGEFHKALIVFHQMVDTGITSSQY